MDGRFDARVRCALVLAGIACAGPDIASSDDDTGADASTAGDPTGDDAHGDATGEPTTTTGDDDGADATSSTTRDDAAEGSGSEESGGAPSLCNERELQLVDVELQFEVHRVAGEDLVAHWDPAQGSHACARVFDEHVVIQAWFGPFDDGMPLSHLYIDILDGARLYDLSVDAVPGDELGEFGVIQLSYGYETEPAHILLFDTANSGGIGTVDVVALPVDGVANVEFTAAGAIPSRGGWEFDLSFRTGGA
jgi:hypothetical protein